MLLFNITVGLIMLAAFIGMIMCAKKQHANSAAKPAAVGLLVVVVACAIMVLHRNIGSGQGATLREYEMKYTKSSTYAIGKELASQMPGASVLVIVGDGDRDNPNSPLNIMIEGFKEGFGNDITDITIEKPKVTQPKGAEFDGMESQLEDLVTAKDINALLTKYNNRKIVITLMGLPKDAGQLKLWEDFNKNPRTCQKLILMHGDPSKMAKFINVGLIPVMLIDHPNAKYTEDAPPSSLEDCFDERFLLLTQKNINEMAQKYPERFKIR